MATLLLKNARVLVTMDDARREIAGGGVFIRDNVIEAVGPGDELPARADSVLDMAGRVVLPGLINTHHHLYQTLTRALAQDLELFGWLKSLYPIWQALTPEMAYISALTGMAEMLLSGCTTSSDHLYLYPNGVRLDDTIRAAGDIGMRFTATRGSMSVSEIDGGLPPDSLVEDEDAILRDTRRVIEAFHDPDPYAMVQVAVAPCSPFSVSQDLMRESAALARSYGVRLHTHLAENANDVAYSLENFGARPGDYAESLGWVGDDVWHAHCVQLEADEIALFGQTGTGVAHCPGSNMRLASGIAPIRRMLDERVPVGIGVDGSASNDSGHVLAETRLAMLLQRVGYVDPGALTAREALEIATRGGARVLGREDVGALAPGMAADVCAFRLDALSYAGAQSDPVGALAFCASQNADLVIVNGRVIVQDGRLLPLDLGPHIERHNTLARELLEPSA
jgi:cytosine/adenosine deaminase-related metal-dependent hydrolase